MLEVVGKVLKKESQNKRAKLFIHAENGNAIFFQVRQREIIQLVSIDTGNMVRVQYEIDLSGEINNLIVRNIIPLGM